WTNPDAIAAFQMMTHAYGHDHADKFAIMLHGAGGLLYPDFNAIQYENPAIGWTRNTIGHSTLMVDEEDTRPAPCTVRHDFTPEAKFLSTAASGVYDGVEQTRTLLLTDRYLLDLFSARSPFPRVYDYLLHSMGGPEPVTAGFRPDVTAGRRFWPLERQRGIVTANPWQLDFVADGEARASARVRVSMAAAADTRVVCGSWGRRIAERAGRAAAIAIDPGMLAVRRGPVRSSIFAATHEPHRSAATPTVRGVSVVAETADAVVVRVDGTGFTDYAAVDFRHGEKARCLTLVAREDPASFFAFEGYGFLRIPHGAAGGPIARGGWTGYHCAAADGGAITFGEKAAAEAQPTEAKPSVPFQIRPGVARLIVGSGTTVTLSFTNPFAEPIRGSLEGDAAPGVSIAGETTFGPVAPGGTAALAVRLAATADARPGLQRIPCRLRYRLGQDAAERETLNEPLAIAVGPTLVHDYAAAPEPRYRVLAAGYTAEAMMTQGLVVRLACPDGADVGSGEPLFTAAADGMPLLHGGEGRGFTWPTAAPAAVMGLVADRLRYVTEFHDDRITVG
ncbi:MAG: heparinase II/III family protein, partial [Planctomycetia bacterium]|nr:heparinase II/III family protein [Planctomycetia bacterium]